MHLKCTRCKSFLFLFNLYKNSNCNLVAPEHLKTVVITASFTEDALFLSLLMAFEMEYFKRSFYKSKQKSITHRKSILAKSDFEVFAHS